MVSSTGASIALRQTLQRAFEGGRFRMVVQRAAAILDWHFWAARGTRSRITSASRAVSCVRVSVSYAVTLSCDALRVDVFANYVLPILLEMSGAPLESFPLQRRIRELGITDEDESTRLIDLMIHNGLITVRGGKNGAGVWYVVHDVFLTSKGLAQLNLWPSDDERALFLLRQVVEALDDLATEAELDGGDVERVGRLRTAARSLRLVVREASTEIAAKVISNLATGG
jgi:hypothetical protein